jgi:hypothetical protein
MKPKDFTERIFYDGLATMEVSPSPNIWARVEDCLPDAVSITVAQQFDGFSPPPPPNIWDKIDGMLEEATDQHENEFDCFKALDTYEVTAPSTTWTHIDSELPSAEDLVFKTLDGFVAPAPMKNWEEIAARLDENVWSDSFSTLADNTPTAPDNWEAILSRMESIEEEDYAGNFSRLEDIEVKPREGSWNKIEAQLENNNQSQDLDSFFAPLKNYEAAPVAAMWSKIETRLEEEDDKIFAQLRNAERTPPPRVWDKIERDLPFNPFLSYHLKNFARVAAVLLVGWSLTLLYQNWGVTNNDHLADNNDTPSKKSVIDTNGLKTVDPKLRRPSTITDENASVSGDLIAKIDNSENGKKSDGYNPYSNKEYIKDNAKYPKGVVKNEEKLDITPFNTATPQNSVAIDNSASTAPPVVTPLNENDFLTAIEPRTFSIPALTGMFNGDNSIPIPDNISKNIDKEFKDAKDYETLNPDGSNPILSAPEVEMENDPIEGIKTGYRGWVVSGFYGNNATQLYQSDLKNQLANGGDIRSAIKMAHNFGAAVGYQFTAKTTLFAEYKFAQQGQNYLRTQGMSTENVSIATTYHYVALPVRYRIANAYINKPIAVSLIAGPQFGLLNKYSVSPSDNTIDDNLLVQKELGIIGGVDFEWYSEKMRNCYLSVGVRGAYGRDVHKILQSDATQQSSLGIRLGLHYRLGNKNK